MSPSQKLIAICPECNHETIYNGTALRPRITCSECKTRFYIKTQKTQSTQPSINTGGNAPKEVLLVSPPLSIPPQNTTKEAPQFIDDPDELLMSVAIRELNKPNPDSRWANILIACKKEKITNKSNVIDQFKQLPTKALVNLLSKNLQEGL